MVEILVILYVRKKIIVDRNIAEAIAEVCVFHIYGEEAAQTQKPYVITDEQKCWVIEGKPPDALGGSFLVKLNKLNGQFIRITHSK